MLRLHTARMPTVAVRFEELAAATEGFSPADLKALAQEAALAAMARTEGDAQTPAVQHEDFLEAVKRLEPAAQEPPPPPLCSDVRQILPESDPGTRRGEQRSSCANQQPAAQGAR